MLVYLLKLKMFFMNTAKDLQQVQEHEWQVKQPITERVCAKICAQTDLKTPRPETFGLEKSHEIARCVSDETSGP